MNRLRWNGLGRSGLLLALLAGCVSSAHHRDVSIKAITPEEARSILAKSCVGQVYCPYQNGAPQPAQGQPITRFTVSDPGALDIVTADGKTSTVPITALAEPVIAPDPINAGYAIPISGSTCLRFSDADKESCQQTASALAVLKRGAAAASSTLLK